MPIPLGTATVDPLIVAGVRNDFTDAYMISQAETDAELAPVMKEVPVDQLKALFAYPETAPYFKRWPRGETIPSEAFRAIGFNITSLDWAVSVPIHANDIHDDQTGSAITMARFAGQHGGELKMQVFAQICQDLTNAELLEATPLAPDGAAMFSTTDGDGADRFGLTEGNSRTGSGITNPSDVRSDLFSAMSDFRSMLNPKGKRLWTDGILKKGLIVYYNPQHMQVVEEAVKQSRTVHIVQEAGANVAATVPTNLLLEGNYNIETRPNPYFTDDHLYVFLRGAQHPPIISTLLEPLRELMATFENSDHARRTKELSIQWDFRRGFSPFIPYGAIKINTP